MKNTFRHMVKTIIAVFFLLLQTMPAIGPWISLMFVPLGYYLLLYFMWHPEYLGHNISILFSQQTLLGQIVTVAGLAIFLGACIQFLGKHGKIITTGLYAVVRHPQYFGIVIVTLGLSISCCSCSTAQREESLDTFRLNTFLYGLLRFSDTFYLHTTKNIISQRNTEKSIKNTSEKFHFSFQFRLQLESLNPSSH